MKTVVLLLVMLFLSSAHAVGEDLEDQHELNYWADWSDGGEQNQVRRSNHFGRRQQESSYLITSLFHARIKSLLFTAIFFSELLLPQNVGNVYIWQFN
ncbi:hypothetical protein E2320_001798 [Naja naja]|nr:hypothetical protein E2320_001798 [Naja naja]